MSAIQASSVLGRKPSKLRVTRPAIDASPDSSDGALRFRTSHPKSPTIVDLTEFATGRMTPDRPIGKVLWGGPVNARPALIHELAPALREQVRLQTSGSVGQVVVALRAFWRVLDTCGPELDVLGIDQISDVHGALLNRINFPSAYMTNIRLLVNAAKRGAGLPEVYWTIPDPKRGSSSLPRQDHIRAIYHALVARVFDGVFTRWDKADELASTGFDWSRSMSSRAGSMRWNDHDRHATYRGLIELRKHPCPSPRLDGTTNADTGMGVTWHSGAIKPLVPLVFGLYPSRDDVIDILHLFLLRTGWNAGTALNVDVNDYRRSHPTAHGYHVVHAIKDRPSPNEQVAIGQDKAGRSPGNLLMRLIARTKPLRTELQRSLAEAKKREAQCGGSDELTMLIARLTRQVRSPWLFVSLGDFTIGALEPASTIARQDNKSHLSSIIATLNETRAKDQQIPETMRVTDFRDAFIGFAYERSGFLWLIATLAAGHRTPKSGTPYLTHIEQRRGAWAVISRFGEHLWNELRTRRIADPAILFALVQRGEVSEEQRERWLAHRDRTRVGMGCKDVHSPPHYIAPRHVADRACRVQRCTLCQNGVLFDDSYDHLARRVAELRHLMRSMALAAWMNSSFPDEMESLELSLRLFDPTLVTASEAFWTQEIKVGRYRVPQFEGAYA